MINAHITLVGNVGGLEAQYTPQGKLIVKGTLAVNIGYGDKAKTDWYNFIAWEKTAELLNKFAEKGTGLIIMGLPRINIWNDDNGVKHTKVEVTVQDFKVTARGWEDGNGFQLDGS